MTKKKKTKGAVINVRCTEQQKSLLETVASREGLGLSTWLLHAGLLAVQDRRTKEAQR